MKLWSMPSSGNSYKVRLLLSLLQRECEVVDVEYQTAALDEAKRTDRLPFGKAPVLEADGRLIAESNAILFYLGEGTAYIPQDPHQRAAMLSWMFWEQNQHEGTVAVRAALLCYPHRAADATPQRMAELLDAGHANLQIMENRLTAKDWLVGNGISLADICLYAYTHTADTRGGFDLGRFPGIKRWIARIAALPGYRELSQ